MGRSLLPKHVVAVMNAQKDPLKALQMFNSAKMEQGFKHTLVTYKFMVEKLGSHGKFELMEDLLAEMRLNFDNSLLEGVYISAIRSYGRARRFEDAMSTFDRIDFFDCKASVHSHNAIMNLMVELGFFDQAHKFYLKMKLKGVSPDIYSHVIRIKSFCRTNRPDSALRLLRNVPSQGCESNSVAYCTVVGGFYDTGCETEAREVFDEMLGLGMCPDVATFNKVIQGLARKGHVTECERLFDKVLKRGVLPNLFTYNIFIQGLCRKGSTDLAVRLLDGVAREGLAPGVITYNILIAGLCKNLRVEEAGGYLRKMVNKGLKPDGFTYNLVIYGYCKTGKVQKADKVFKDAKSRGFDPDEFTYCALIDGFWRVGDKSCATSAFNEAMDKKSLNPSIVLYNTMVKGMSRNGLMMESLQLMKDMEARGCKPDIWTYNLVVKGMCKMGNVSGASKLIDDAISQGCVPDIFTFNTIVDGHCKKFSLDNAVETVNNMWDLGVKPDVVTFNTLLNGLCKARKYEEVKNMFREMSGRGCEPNIISYSIVIESLCLSRKPKIALCLLDELREKGLTPDIVCFGILLTGLAKNGDLDLAYKLFVRTEKEFKVSHTTSTYNIMINAFCERLNVTLALKVFLEMKEKVNEFNTGPDGYTYRVMVEGFCRVGNTDLSKKFLLKMVQKGFAPYPMTFGRVMNSLCVNHRVREAAAIIHLMVKKGIVPRTVDAIFEADKKVIAAPRIVLEDLLTRNCITYQTYDFLYDKITNKQIPDSKTLTSYPVFR